MRLNDRHKGGENGIPMSQDCPCELCRKLFRPTLEERMEQARQLGQKIAVRIEIEYEDGEVVWATGTDAFEVMSYLNTGQMMSATHGMEYKGPTLKPKPKTET
jgi:hypothetical protein